MKSMLDPWVASNVYATLLKLRGTACEDINGIVKVGEGDSGSCFGNHRGHVTFSKL